MAPISYTHRREQLLGKPTVDRVDHADADEVVVATDVRLVEAGGLRAFVELAWPVLEPAHPFLPNWHIDAITETLEALAYSQIRNLLITVPPRCAKSVLGCVMFPAWVWATQSASRRFLYASYDGDLSTRDSVACRRLIESEWYQARWGQQFKIVSDQNQKTRFENDKRGVRIATSVGGGATGEGGDAVVCVPGDVKITTDRGDIPIQVIVERRLPVRVLGPTGRWQVIEAYERRPGRPTIELFTEDANQVIVTSDHLVETVESGWLAGRAVLESLNDGEIHVRRVSKSVRAGSVSCREMSDWPILLAPLFRAIRAWPEQSQLDWRARVAALQGLSAGIQVEEGGIAAEGDLLCAVLCSTGPEAQEATTVSGVSAGVFRRSGQLPTTVLFPQVLQHCPSHADSRRPEWAVRRWSMVDAIRPWLHESSTEADSRARRQSMRYLLFASTASRSPYQPVSGRSLGNQLGDIVCVMPQARPHWSRAESRQSRVDMPVRVVAARRCASPDAVFNLRVAPDHAYYANGILTHNCDDPHHVQRADSDVIRQAAIDWWDNVMSTRVDDPKTATFLVIAQRTHVNDLAGHLLQQGTYELLSIPMEYESTRVKFPSVVRTRDPRTEPGQLMWPERFGRVEVEMLKAKMTPRAVAAQLQQSPTAKEGNIILRDWLQFWSVPPAPAAGERMTVVQSWDLAFKDSKASSYVVGQVWAKVGGGAFYLLWQVRAIMGFAATVDAIKLLTAKFPEAKAKYVEEKANGAAVIDHLKLEIPGLIPVDPRGSKEARLEAVSPLFKAKNVWIPSPTMPGYQWVADYVEELVTAPNAAYWDQADATSQALDQLSTQGPKPLMIYAR